MLKIQIMTLVATMTKTTSYLITSRGYNDDHGGDDDAHDDDEDDEDDDDDMMLTPMRTTRMLTTMRTTMTMAMIGPICTKQVLCKH